MLSLVMDEYLLMKYRLVLLHYFEIVIPNLDFCAVSTFVLSLLYGSNVGIGTKYVKYGHFGDSLRVSPKCLKLIIYIGFNDEFMASDASSCCNRYSQC